MGIASSIIGFPNRESGAKSIWNIKTQIRNLSEDPTVIAGEFGQDCFATCILHIYVTDEGVSLSDMGSSANVRSHLTKIPNQAGSAHQGAFEVTDKFKQLFDSPSASVPWRDKGVYCQVNL